MLRMTDRRVTPLRTRVKTTTALLLTVILALAACGGRDQPQDASAEEIRQSALAAAEDAQTLRFDTTLSVKLRTKGPQRVDLTVSAVTSGQIDNVARLMESEMTSTMALPPEAGGRQQTSVTSYVVDDVLYARTATPGQSERWSSQRLQEQGWEDLNQLGHEAEMLRTAQIELLRSDRLRGVDCYVLQLTPDTSSLRQKLARLPGLEELPADAASELDDMIQRFSSRVWVAQDTFHLLRDETAFTIVLDAEALGPSSGQEGEVTLDAEMRTEFKGHDQPVSIELPPELSGRTG